MSKIDKFINMNESSRYVEICIILFIKKNFVRLDINHIF